MQIGDFLGIGFVGVALSIVVQSIKDRWGGDSAGTKALVLVLSLFVGGLYVAFRDTPIFQTVLMVLGAASTVYALFFK